jgi:EmrB/QacA subfamily drug resistance transporter
MLSSKNKWVVFTLVAAGVFMSTLDSSIVNVALPTMMQSLSTDLATIKWVMMIYLLTISALLLSFGRLSDIKGRRWVFCRGFFLFALGSFFCGIAGSAIWLILARSFQGIGAAMIMACSTALVVDTFPENERGKALGMIGTVVASGLMIGPALGGLILDFFSWRVIFFINIPIGVTATIMGFKILKGGPADITKSEPFDWVGGFLITICFCSFIMMLTRLYDWGIFSPKILGLLFLSVSCGLILLIRETPGNYPLFHPDLLRIRLFILPAISSMILFICLFTMIFLMPFYLVYAKSFPMDKVGYIMVTPFVLLFFISPVSGAISDRIGSRILCTIGMLIMAGALFSLSTLTTADNSLSIVWRLGLAGFGSAVFTSPNNSIIMSSVPLPQRGSAAGTVATARNLGMVIGVAVAGLLFNTMFRSLSGGQRLTEYHPDMSIFFISSFQYAMSAGIIFALIGVVVSWARGTEPIRSGKGHFETRLKSQF